MAEGLGLWLRRAREMRNLTLEDAEKKLRIRHRYLQALELGDYTALPGEIQTRGFLRNYARFLGLPVDEALARYEAEAAGRPLQPRMRPAVDEARNPIAERPSVFAPPPIEEEIDRPAQELPRFLLPSLLGALILFALITLLSFLYLQFVADEAAPILTPTATLLAPPLPTAALTPAVTPSADFIPAVDGTLTLQLLPTEHAWVRVVADGEVVFQGVATPGQPLQAVARAQCAVETGNGGAFNLTVNGVDWGALGGVGQISRRAWTPTGETPVSVP